MNYDIMEVEILADDILNTNTIEQLLQFRHHKYTTIFDHSYSVAIKSIHYANLLSKLHIKVDRRSLVRGALLHDYFLYDWHTGSKLHGIVHPKIAYMNAIRDFKINNIEANIIKRHMFPLTLIPPTKRESIIVCIADKVCATKELLKRGEIYATT